MRRNWWKFVRGLGLLGCGGLPNPLPVGFVNQTKHSDAERWGVWKAAQESLAQEVDMNPLQRSSSGAPADIRPGDPRALEVMPHHLNGERRAGCDRPRSVGCYRHGAFRSDWDDRVPGAMQRPLCRGVFVLQPRPYPIRRVMGGAGRQLLLCAGA